MSRAVSKTELYQRRRHAGQCVQCGVAAGGKSKCALCAEKDKTARQQRRARRKSAGVCTACGQAAKEGRALCQLCIDKRSKVSMKRYHRNKAAGVCPYCGGEIHGEFMCETCRDVHRKAAHDHYHKRVIVEGRCQRCGGSSQPGRILCLACTAQRKTVDDLRYARDRDETFRAYGGFKCVRCGEIDPDVLQIDHIDGGGTQHRKKIGRQNIYTWLRQQHFPPGYQVLCANCNTKKYREEFRQAVGL